MSLIRRIRGPFVQAALIRFNSTLSNRKVLSHRALVFEQELKRQMKEIERVEKIEVKVQESGKEITLLMNKHLSTPNNCAMHLSELFVKRSVVAKVNDVVWDMHRPLTDNCTIRFLHFKDENPHEVNNAYWRSCAFLLGYVLETSFKEDVFVDLCHAPQVDIKSGSFIYDAQINLPNWKPTQDELRSLSIAGASLKNKNLNFERLDVKYDVAEEMFKYNKVGDFVDLSGGPLISNTALIGRFQVSSIHNFKSAIFGETQRIQAVSIPTQLNLHYWTFNLLSERAAKLNQAQL